MGAVQKMEPLTNLQVSSLCLKQLIKFSSLSFECHEIGWFFLNIAPVRHFLPVKICFFPSTVYLKKKKKKGLQIH